MNRIFKLGEGKHAGPCIFRAYTIKSHFARLLLGLNFSLELLLVSLGLRR